MIRYITHNQIDFKAWDNCILHSSKNRIYATSAYLNAMAPQWDALVLNKYETVMPLVYNKKWGQYYLYQPPFTAQLGVFGAQITSQVFEQFISEIPSKFKYWDIALNNTCMITKENLSTQQRKNYTLKLDDYKSINSQYRDNVKRNVKKAHQSGIIKKDIPLVDIINLSKEYTIGYKEISAKSFNSFEALYETLQNQGKATSYGVYIGNSLVASAAFVFDEKRAYYVLVGHHPNSKTIGASHALIDAFIKDNCEKDLTLDFEGSDIAGVAFFYEGFGATYEYYHQFKYNNLPFWMKWLKS